MMTRSETAAYLREHDRYRIVTHRNPDGDTVGSAGALCLGLRSMGKEAYLFPNPQITPKFLPFVEKLREADGYIPETVIAVDVADVRMYPKGFDTKPELCIDHHASNTLFAENTLLDGKKAACGEIIMELLEELGVEITPEMADLLYVAVSTDCGCFQYKNVTPDTLRAAAHLMELGADTGELNRYLFRSLSRGKLLLEGMINTSMRQYADGRLNVAVVTQEMLRKSGATENDMDDIASLAGRLEGVTVSLTLREQEDGAVKVSLRTNGNPDAALVCGKFGGGGHPMASGCTLRESMEETERLLVEAIQEAWH